jgi:glyceraldehyde 3-phosphate dehydrogenase
LKYDSVHGKFKGTIEKVDENTIKVNGQTIKIFNEKNPADIKWGSVGAKLVAESSGAFLT